MMSITQVYLEDQIRENPDLDKQGIIELMEWNDRQSHLPKLSVDDLAMFYLSNSCNMLTTKKNITNYFVMRHFMPEFFANRDDLISTKLEQVYDTVFITTLPTRTRDNHKVILAKLMDKDPKKYIFENAVKVMNMVMDAGVYDDGPDNTYVFIFDINGATMEHRNTLSHMGLKKFYQYIRRGGPIRWVGAHYTNTGSGNEDFQQFVESQIVNSNLVENKMIHFHSNMESLLIATGMERSMLPKEMGGEAGPAMELQRRQIKKLVSLYPVFARMETKIKLSNPEKVSLPQNIFGHTKDF